jgi:thiol:disulfide interchange protein DsbA
MRLPLACPTRLLAPFALLAALLCAPLAAFAASPAAPVAGVDYVEIEGGRPYRATPGTIEVAEVFAYWCHHCADFAPKLEAWKAGLPADVRVTYVPLPYDEADALARAYFAAERMGVLGRTHAATFRAIHADGALPKNATADEIAAFYAGLGVDADRFRAAMQGFQVGSQLTRARDFAIGSGVPGTPTLIVDGRYRVVGRTLDDILRIAGQLVAARRGAR